MSAEDQWLAPEEAACRLLIHLPASLPFGDGRRADALLSAEAVAGLLVETADLPTGVLEDLAAAAERHQRACLLVDAVERVVSTGAHGVHLSNWRAVAEARRRLGAGWIIGATCGQSRHAAMVAGESGADYVLFGELADGGGKRRDLRLELVAWWAELFYLPCAVALGTDLSQAARFIEAGADFLVPTLVEQDGASTSVQGILELASQLSAARPRGTGEP